MRTSATACGVRRTVVGPPGTDTFVRPFLRSSRTPVDDGRPPVVERRPSVVPAHVEHIRALDEPAADVELVLRSAGTSPSNPSDVAIEISCTSLRVVASTFIRFS